MAGKIKISTLMGRDVAQVGYVICPSNLTKSEYIAECFNLCTVSLMFENGATQNDVKIPEFLLQDVIFPNVDKNEILGSAVLTVTHPHQKYPIIVAVLQKGNERTTLRYGQKGFVSREDSSFAQVITYGKGGEVIISSYSDTGGTITIKTNKQIDLRSSDVNIIALDTIHQTASEDIVLDIHKEGEDPAVYLSLSSIGQAQLKGDGLIKVDSKEEVRLGSKNPEPAPKGDALNKILKEFMEEVRDMQVLTAFGPAPLSPANQLALNNIISKLDTILSDVVTIGNKE